MTLQIIVNKNTYNVALIIVIGKVVIRKVLISIAVLSTLDYSVLGKGTCSIGDTVSENFSTRKNFKLIFFEKMEKYEKRN